jgi:hypothetical protein
MKSFNRILMLAVALFAAEFTYAQKFPGLDPSPADIAYFREGNQRNTAPVMKVSYGRPQKKGRKMLGETEPFGKVWRLGANEATEIKLYKDVTFGDKKISAGTYSMYAIPTADKWTIIFNTKLDTWGAYSYEESKDVARIDVPVAKADKEFEAFTIDFNGTADSGNMFFAWENTMVTLPFKY